MSHNLFDVTGLNVVVTGGAGGIGSAISRGFIEGGAKVFIADRAAPEDLKKSTTFIETDFSDVNSVKHMLAQIDRKVGDVHVLINAAGVTISSASATYDYDDWRLTMSVNLEAVFLICQHVGQSMIDNQISGSIVNVTSIGAEMGFPNNPAYAASKGGLKTLTKALSVEWGQYGIRVNNLTPGYTETPMNEKSVRDPELYSQRAEKASLGRWALPSELVGPALFLGTKASSFVTGLDLIVDGGWTSKGL